MRKFFTGFVVAAVCMIVSASSFTVYAYNGDYMQFDKWYGTNNAVTETFEQPSIFGTATGTLKYYIDSQEHCLYIYIGVTNEEVIRPDEVKIEFSVTDSNENYLFSIDSNGLCDCVDDMSRFFVVHQNYETYPKSKSGRYACCVDFRNGKDRNRVTFSLWINGHRYLLKENMVVDTFVEKVTTTTTAPVLLPSSREKATAESTHRSATDKKETTTKFYKPMPSTSKGAEKSAKPASADTNSNNTKYYAQPTENIQEDNPAIGGVTVAQYQPKNTARMSDKSKIMLCIAAGIAVVGVGLILAGVIRKVFYQKLEEEKERIRHNDSSGDMDDGFDF